MLDIKNGKMIYGQYYWTRCLKCNQKYAKVAGGKPHKCAGVKLNTNDNEKK